MILIISNEVANKTKIETKRDFICDWEDCEIFLAENMLFDNKTSHEMMQNVRKNCLIFLFPLTSRRRHSTFGLK